MKQIRLHIRLLMATVVTAGLALMAVGCAHGRYVGQVGDTKYYKLNSPSFFGPSINLIVAKKTNEPTPVLLQSAAGNGVGPAMVGAGGNVAASYLFGSKLRPDQVNVSGGGGGSSASGSSAGASSTSSSASSTTTGNNNFVPPGHQ